MGKRSGLILGILSGSLLFLTAGCGSRPQQTQTPAPAAGQQVSPAAKAQMDAINRSNLPPEAKAMEMGRAQRQGQGR